MLEAVLVTEILLALLAAMVVLALLIGLNTDGKMLARLPIGLVIPPLPDPAFYAVAVVVFVTTAVETATVGAAAVPTG